MNQDFKTLLYSYGLPITLFLHLCVSITLYIYSFWSTCKTDHSHYSAENTGENTEVRN